METKEANMFLGIIFNAEGKKVGEFVDPISGKLAFITAENAKNFGEGYTFKTYECFEKELEPES
jgi:hypothetical protein